MRLRPGLLRLAGGDGHGRRGTRGRRTDGAAGRRRPSSMAKVAMLDEAETWRGDGDASDTVR